MDRPADRRSAGDESQQCLARPQAPGRGRVRGRADAAVQSGVRATENLRRRRGGEADRRRLLEAAGRARALDAASAGGEGRRTWNLETAVWFWREGENRVFSRA